MIRKDAPESVRERLIKTLRQEMDRTDPENKTYLLLSMDFSHYKTKALAASEDRKSLSLIESGDLATLKQLDIDCKPGLAVLLGLAGDRRRQVTRHLNSAEIVNEPELKFTTSYFNIFFE
jgi:AmmeMemoRadiSam system protein B